MQFYEKNPVSKPGFFAETRTEVHKWGQRTFASNYARGGFAATAFAPTSSAALASPWRKTHRYGSPEHMRNLSKIQNMHPQDLNIRDSIEKASKSAGKASLASKFLGAGMAGAFIALPAFTTPGGPAAKGKAMVAGAAEFAGWEIGSRLGLGIGAAIGGPIGAAIGWIGGGLLGSMGFGSGTHALLDIPDKMVDKERAKRTLNWVGDTSAFSTRGAATMRQQSLQSMNRGMMSARSMLGREGVMLHQ